jgi:hypothetical protein
MRLSEDSNSREIVRQTPRRPICKSNSPWAQGSANGGRFLPQTTRWPQGSRKVSLESRSLVSNHHHRLMSTVLVHQKTRALRSWLIKRRLVAQASFELAGDGGGNERFFRATEKRRPTERMAVVASGGSATTGPKRASGRKRQPDGWCVSSWRRRARWSSPFTLVAVSRACCCCSRRRRRC